LCCAAAPAFADPKQDFLRALRGGPPAAPAVQDTAEPLFNVPSPAPAAGRVTPYKSSPSARKFPETLIPPALPDIPDIKAAALIPPPAAAQLFVRKHIMGKGETMTGTLSAFLLDVNGEADVEFVQELAASYVEEAGTEGVNHDIAFAQMCLETGYLRYGGLVTPDMNNFCGLGSTGPGVPGERFVTARLGVRAHIQHLKAYASADPVKQELIDPRARWVRKGSAPLIQNLAGTWAADQLYADKIGFILARLYEFTVPEK
jgi:hypothetical protein